MKNLSKKLTLTLWATALSSLPVIAHEGDDPMLTRVMIDQFEWRDGDDEADPYVLEAQGWIGKDLHKLWIKTDVERVDGETEEAEIQALYSRAIAPFWDVQVGVRQDLKPTPEREWGVIGIQGLAPYFFEIDAALFVGDSGDTGARLSAEYEWMLTQKVVLSPEVSVNFYGQNDMHRLTGSGLSDGQAGLRLRYEIRREFAPYIGVNWTKSFGNTADFVREHGEPTSDAQWVAGVRAWF
ncbi:MAG TPA: copper resistance protein CopB [Cellvibrio sp.]|nr:copper resistance protein CopB [Cellvibrio sp.]